MYRFFETIRIENGEVCNVEYHFRRMLLTAIDFNLNHKVISDAIDILIAKSFDKTNSRCKLMYDNQGFDFEFSELKVRPVVSLKIVFDDLVDYSYKYSDRNMIDELFSNRQDCDDVLIVKNGKLTDTSIANILLFDGENWVTPDSPLLNGTCRQRLIDEGRIEVKEVLLTDMKAYSSIMLVNALRDFDEVGALNIDTSVKI
jgi:4-amino-4-deoxychorismate lyase